VEAGELHLAHERFDLRELVERLGATFAPQAERRGLVFTLDIDPIEAIVTADARRVEQVLYNLLSNALKFTPRGTLVLRLAREDGSFVVTVVDSGVGIRAEDMDKLFRAFSQIETGRSGLREGTGLGLAISKSLAESMGGRITARSEWGKGSSFAFTLPAGGHA
jgi:protein-histidine pros-kinase